MKRRVLTLVAIMLAVTAEWSVVADEPMRDPLQAKAEVAARIGDVRQAMIATMTEEGYSLSEEGGDLIGGKIQTHLLKFTAHVRSPHNPEVECLFTADLRLSAMSSQCFTQNFVRVIACYLKRRQTTVNSTMVTMAITAK